MDEGPGRAMLLSVHPRHAAAILAGRKTTELRRTRPSAPPGTPVLLYATAPVAAVIGTCRLAGVRSGPSGALRPAVLEPAAITGQEYDSYFDGARAAHALHLADVTALPVPLTLAQLRRAGAFTPPQTWHLLDADSLQRLAGDHPAATRLRDLLAPAASPTAPPAHRAVPLHGLLLHTLRALAGCRRRPRTGDRDECPHMPRCERP